MENYQVGFVKVSEQDCQAVMFFLKFPVEIRALNKN